MDIVLQARGHMKQTRFRHLIDTAKTKRAKQQLSTRYGISCNSHQLYSVPGFDFVVERPGDLAHSEFGGVNKMYHQLLLDVALTPALNT